MSKDLVHARRELPKTLTGRSWGALAPSTLRYFKDAGGPTPTPLLNSLFARYKTQVLLLQSRVTMIIFGETAMEIRVR
jgi:hypothetical protein